MGPKRISAVLLFLLLNVKIPSIATTDFDPPAVMPNEDDVIINEFVVNPTSGKEYVELLVVRPGGADLRGWTLSDVGTRAGSPSGAEGDVTLPSSASFLGCVPQGTYVVIVLTTPSANTNTLTEDTTLDDGNNRLVLIAGVTNGMATAGTLDISTNENLQVYAGNRATGPLIDQVLAGNNTSLIAGATWGDNNSTTTGDNINAGSAMPSNAAVRFVPSATTLDGFQDNDTGSRFSVDANSYGSPGSKNSGVSSDSSLTNPSFSGGSVPAGCYHGVTISGAATLEGDTTVYGTLLLAADLTTGSFSLIMPGSGSSAGTGEVIGTVIRTGFVAGGDALSFGNPFTTLRFAPGSTVPSAVSVTLVKSSPPDFSTAVARTYTIAATGGGSFSATLRLHYRDEELGSNVESALVLWRFNGSAWIEQPVTASDSTDNWVETSGVTELSRWTLASSPSNRSPIAQCRDVTVSAGAGCLASASIDNGSFDPDGDPITLQQSPPGPYPLGTTMVTLTVADNHGASDQCTGTVTVVNHPPSAAAGQDQTAEEGSAVTLMGSGTDPDPGQTLTFQWRQTGGPPVTLSGADTPVLEFMAPPVDGCDQRLEFEWKVTDSCGASATDVLTVRVDDVQRLRDERNGNGLTLNLCRSFYTFQTPQSGTFTGPVRIRQRGTLLSYESPGGSLPLLRGVIDLRRRIGVAVLVAAQGRSRRIFSLVDWHIDR
ncbi:MAG TPA: hypothetical protein VNM72_06035 [Blastocatellia bacterium]|nr:hypothetical protein [Blastocatellia bacterium]